MIANANNQSNGISEICRAIEAQLGRDLRASLLARWGTNDADDIVQEAFLLLWQELNAGGFPGVSIDNWNQNPHVETIRKFLFSRAKFIRLATYRRNARWKSLEEPTTIAGRVCNSSVVLSEIEVAIEACKPKQREVFLLRQQGRSFEKIGAELGISTGTARTVYFRARQFLRKRLKDYANYFPRSIDVRCA